MKPIPPVDICKYFWTGEGVPSVTTGIPTGAVYINKTTGDHYLKRHNLWVKQTLSDLQSAAIIASTAEGLNLLALTAPSASSVIIMDELGAASLVEGATFGPAAPASITTVSGVVTAAS